MDKLLILMASQAMITYAVPGLLIPTETATRWSPPPRGRTTSLRMCRWALNCVSGNLRRFPASCTVHTQRLCSLFYLTIGPLIATHADERRSNQAGSGGRQWRLWKRRQQTQRFYYFYTFQRSISVYGTTTCDSSYI